MIPAFTRHKSEIAGALPTVFAAAISERQIQLANGSNVYCRRGAWRLNSPPKNRNSPGCVIGLLSTYWRVMPCVMRSV